MVSSYFRCLLLSAFVVGIAARIGDTAFTDPVLDGALLQSIDTVLLLQWALKENNTDMLDIVMQDVSSIADMWEPVQLPQPDLTDGVNTPEGWQNWAQTLVPVKRDNVSEPRTAAELASAVERAAKAGNRIRGLGHAHTWTPVFAERPDTVVVRSAPLGLQHDSVIRSPIELVQKADRGTLTPALVKIASGVTTGELALWVDDAANAESCGYVGLSTDVVLETVRYGGIISMACHGTSRFVRDSVDSVVGMTVVTADESGSARVRKYTAQDPDWDAVRACFGLMGFIQDITLRLDGDLTKPYVYNKNDFTQRQSALFGNANQPADGSALRSLVEENWSTELFWFPLNGVPPLMLLEKHALAAFLRNDWDPYADVLWMNLMTERTDAQRETVRLYQNNTLDGDSQAAQITLGKAINEYGQSTGSLQAQALYGVFGIALLRAENRLPKGRLHDGVLTLPRSIHYQKAIDDFPVNDFEMCFKVSEDYSNVVAAWRAAVDIATTYIRNGSNVLNVALEARFTLASKAIISSAYSETPDDGSLYCWMEVLSGRQTPLALWEEYTRKVFDAWTAIKSPAPPKPHWAKWIRQQDVYLVPYVQKVCAKQLEALRLAVQRADPQGLFRTDWLEALLQLPPVGQ